MKHLLVHVVLAASVALSTASCGGKKVEDAETATTTTTAVPTTQIPSTPQPEGCDDGQVPLRALWPGEESRHLIDPPEGPTVAEINGLSDALGVIDVPLDGGDPVEGGSNCSLLIGEDKSTLVHLVRSGASLTVHSAFHNAEGFEWGYTAAGPNIDMGIGPEVCAAQAPCEVVVEARFGQVEGLARTTTDLYGAEPTVVVDRQPDEPGILVIRGVDEEGSTLVLAAVQLPAGDSGAS
jgi:hypothetical protein